MKILTINAGSSSMKFSVWEVPQNKELINGYFQKLGLEDSFYDVKLNGNKIHRNLRVNNHLEAFEYIKKELLELNVVKDLDEIDAIGHRLGHGGEIYKESVIIDDEVINNCKKFIKLVPIHYPSMLKCVEDAKIAFPGKPNTAVFDTSFHQSMDKENFLYAVPYEWYTKYGVRKFGFHGTSHKYIYKEICEHLDNNKLKVISCHIGSGASICAIDSGKVIDTSMGFSSLTGLIMGTRSGDIDASIIPYMMDEASMSMEQVMSELNKKSGLFGICGKSDSRDIEDGIKSGDKFCILAQEMLTRRIANFIAMYNNELNGADVIVFTAGLGENSIDTRIEITNKIKSLGVKIDLDRNNVRGKFTLISSDDSKIPMYVIPTNEELMIAMDTYNLVK